MASSKVSPLGRWEDVLRVERSPAYGLARGAARFGRLRHLLRLPRALAGPASPELEKREQCVHELRQSRLRPLVPRAPKRPPETPAGERPAPGPLVDREIDTSLQLLAHVPFEELQERGWHVQPKHYYWPLNDLAFLRENPGLWLPHRSLAGITVDLAEQEKLGAEGRWIPARAGNGQDKRDRLNEFYWDNNAFPPIDAQVYYGLVRELKPSRVVEVGGGFSTLVLTRAVAANGGDTDVTVIEPDPNPETLGALPEGWKLIPSVVQRAPLNVFSRMTAGDIVFYDGSHCLNTGSDVEWIFFQVLPQLQPGVWIHFHDISWPGDYPMAFVLDEGLSWNEQYVLEAFLAHNDSYRLRFSASMMLSARPDVMEKCFSGLRIGGSVWIEKTG